MFPHKKFIQYLWDRSIFRRCGGYGLQSAPAALDALWKRPGYAANCVSCLSPDKTFNIAYCCSAFIFITDEARRKALQVENSRLTVNNNNAFANVAVEAAFTNGGPWLQVVFAYLQDNVELARHQL